MNETARESGTRPEGLPVRERARRWRDLPIWLRLGTSIWLTIVITWGAMLYWSVREQRAMAIGQAKEFAISLQEITLAGVTGMMETGNAAQRWIFLEEIQQTHDVRSLRVLRGPAVAAEFGPGQAREQPASAREREVIRSGEPSFEVVRDGGGERLLAVLPAVAAVDYLGKNCLACHTVQPGTVLGAVAIEISIDRVAVAADRFRWRVTALSSMLSAPLMIAVFLYIRRAVTRPLRRVGAGLERIADQSIDGSERLEVDGNDEIGRAGLAFNHAMDSARRLIDSQRLAQAVFVNSLEGILICDRENRIQMVNPAFEQITGYSLDEVRGKNPRLINAGIHEASFFERMWTALERTGQWRGEIWNRRKNGEIYPQWLSIGTVLDARGEIEHRFGVFSDITERKRHEETIRFQAYHDALTRLPNRARFRERLEQAIDASRRQGHRLAVLLLDLDHFKLINDTHGHDAGDELLTAVAKRLQESVRERDIVARLGGDEFTILLPEVANAEVAVSVGEKLLAVLSAPFSLSGRDVRISASIGVSLCPDDGFEADDLVKHADTAMYCVKGGGRDGIELFTAEIANQPSRQLAMHEHLEAALARGEFEILYQPQMDLRSSEIRSVEALLRWRHPLLGMVLPDDFIPLAEETGLIVPIGEWVLETACRQAAAWRGEGIDLVMAVNISARQLRRVDIVSTVRKALERSGLPADRLELEITETFAMQNARFAIQTMVALADLGVRLAMDDFGSGYTSLAMLRRMPLTTLKVDRGFVNNMENEDGDVSIVSAVVGLAHKLGLKVVAEGIETPKQRSLLIEIGSDGGQGFDIAKPMPAEEIPSLLATLRDRSVADRPT